MTPYAGACCRCSTGIVQMPVDGCDREVGDAIAAEVGRYRSAATTAEVAHDRRRVVAGRGQIDQVPVDAW